LLRTVHKNAASPLQMPIDKYCSYEIFSVYSETTQNTHNILYTKRRIPNTKASKTYILTSEVKGFRNTLNAGFIASEFEKPRSPFFSIYIYTHKHKNTHTHTHTHIYIYIYGV